MKTRPYLLHALSPLHAGTGHASDVVDLPTARMRATGIPFVPGSSIKGVLRDARAQNAQGEQDRSRLLATFGPDSEQAREHAGALIVGDARLLAMPVRSFRGTFAWVTSPLLLLLAARDFGIAYPLPDFSEESGARVLQGSKVLHTDGKVYLEDLDLTAKPDPGLEPWAKWLVPLVSPSRDIFSGRFVVADDETMTFLWETATQIDARVRLDSTTRTVAPGALWLEESLPSESLLVGLLLADPSRRRDTKMTPVQVLDLALPSEEVIQFGGKASTGRGRCRMVPQVTKVAP